MVYGNSHDGNSYNSWQAWAYGAAEDDWTWEQSKRCRGSWWGKWDDDWESTGTSETASTAEPRSRRASRGRGKGKRSKKNPADSRKNDASEVWIVEGATAHAIVPWTDPREGDVKPCGSPARGRSAGASTDPWDNGDDPWTGHGGAEAAPADHTRGRPPRAVARPGGSVPGTARLPQRT